MQQAVVEPASNVALLYQVQAQRKESEVPV